MDVLSSAMMYPTSGMKEGMERRDEFRASDEFRAKEVPSACVPSQVTLR